MAVKSPVDDGALMFAGQAPVGAGEVLDHRVDAAFQRVRRRFEHRWCVAGRQAGGDLEVVEQVTSPVDGEQAVVGLADPGVGPGPVASTWCGARIGGGLLVEVVVVDGTEVVQAGDPGGRLVKVADTREFQGEAVEGFPGRGAGSAGGVAADDALDVDEAALDRSGWPERFDGGLGALTAVGGDQ